MSTSLVNFTIPTSDEISAIETICKLAVKSKRYAKLLETAGEEGIMLILLMAREFDMKPLVALNGGLTIIDGRVEMSTGQMLAKIRQAGHSIQAEFSIEKDNNLTCTIVAKRKDNGDQATIKYSMYDAKIADLANRPTWKKYPKDMLQARATSRMTRFLFPDVMGGAVYSSGEVSEAIEIRPIPPVQQKQIEAKQAQQIQEVELKVIENKTSLSEQLWKLKEKVIFDHPDFDMINSDEALDEFVKMSATNKKTSYQEMQQAMISHPRQFEEKFCLWLHEKMVTMYHNDDLVKAETAQ